VSERAVAQPDALGDMQCVGVGGHSVTINISGGGRSVSVGGTSSGPMESRPATSGPTGVEPVPQDTKQADNGCREFVSIVKMFLDAANTEFEFFDMRARTFTSAENSGLREWFYNSGGLASHKDKSRKVLSDNGIEPSLRIPGSETWSYVRHFVGGLVSSGRYGLSGLKFFADLEKGDMSEDSRVDRAINEESFDLGISYFGPTTGSLDRARLSLADDIRKRFCE
jgi:hypothetical protein